MAQREWVEKDFYKELGVSSDASDKEIKTAYRKLASELHPDKNPAGAERFKAVSEANSVLSDEAKKKEYDETRRLFANGGFGRGRFGAGGGGGGNFGGFGGDGVEFNLGDLFDAAGQTGGANIGDLFGGLFGRGAQQPRPSRPRRGNDLETETGLSFLEATKGVAMPLRLTSPAPCTNCHGSGARPGTSPKVCPNCNGSGVVSRNQGAFGFSEPCTECRGSGSIIEEPCDECKGTGVTTRTRTINVRIPPGVEDGQRIRLAGQGEAGLRGAPSGDLYVTVHVRPDKVFGRDGDDLTVTRSRQFPRTRFGHNAFGADAGGQGRRPGAQGHLRRPHPAGAWAWGAQAFRRPRRPAGDRQGRGAAEPRGRGGRGAGGLREGGAVQRVRPAGELGRVVMRARRKNRRR